MVLKSTIEKDDFESVFAIGLIRKEVILGLLLMEMSEGV